MDNKNEVECKEEKVDQTSPFSEAEAAQVPSSSGVGVTVVDTSCTPLSTSESEQRDECCSVSSASASEGGPSDPNAISRTRATSPEKKVILLNPIAISNMLKSSPKTQTQAGGDATLGKGKESIGAAPSKPEEGKGSSGGSVPRNEYLKHFMALATALKSEPKKRVFCANTNCNMKTDAVVEASSHARLFFGMSGASTPKICMNCFKKAELFHQKSKALVNNKENLFELTFEIQTASSESVVDLDSPVGSPERGSDLDSVSKKNGEEAESETYSVEMEKLTAILAEKLAKFDIKTQIDKCTASVANEIDDLSYNFSMMDAQMDDMRDKIERATKNYNEKIATQSKVVEIGSVNIDSRGGISVQKAENLGEIDGLSRLGTKALNKALADLRAVEETARNNTEVQTNAVGPAPGMGLSPFIRRMGKLIFVKPKEGQDVYAMHKHLLCYWLPAKILKISQVIPSNRPAIYTVQFQQKVKPRSKSTDDTDCYIKDVTGRQLAFKKPSSITLPVGTRIIAKFKDLLNTDAEVDGLLYAGIIAEVPRDLNKFRYLVFFDDGYAQYVLPNEVLPVVESSPEVWLDVHKNSQDFIKDYIMKFPDRHMIRAETGTSFTVELNGEWLYARIVELDGSLMKVQYLKKTEGVEFEWIYRGSTRLGPLFSRLKFLQAKPAHTVARRHTYSSRRTNFSFEVNRPEDEDDEQKVAKKHTGFDGSRGAGKQPVIRAKNGIIISTLMESEGNMIKIQIPRDCPSPKPYVPHTCSHACAYRYEESKYRKVSPLAIPFHLGWAREVAGANRDKIFYHTPCGARCGSYNEIHSYITRTGAEIPIDYFSLEPSIDCLNEFEPLRRIEFLKDISYGKEWTPVTCVNSLDHELPLYMEYMTARIPGQGVYLSDDPGFLTCCDCEDDCVDKEKCSCWQMTMSGVSFKIAEKEGTKLVGYENRRLKSHVLSGIYECNRKCKCRSTCFNRVVQNKVKWPIQLFKTVAKGWGVRALHDMPQGSFICVYTGQLLTDEGANASGIQVGDEYLAELDFIECNEQIKEDYESDCTDIENEEPGTRSNARLERITNSGQSESKKQEVAKKSTIHKAVKSTGGLKRKHDDGYSSAPSPSSQVSSVTSRPVARKSGSKNGASKQPGKESRGSVNAPPSETSGYVSSASTMSKRSSKDDSDSDDDDNEGQAYSNFCASASMVSQKNAPKLPLRELFGKDESVYIMDAKSMGNFGRYLNHSCDPNVFVQNLFVDTHDPRFPWVAFFTKKDVKAGTELTWDYNYDIGSVPGKTLYCYCLQPGCRGRLL